MNVIISVVEKEGEGEEIEVLRRQHLVGTVTAECTDSEDSLKEVLPSLQVCSVKFR
jgi:hypothetical protein